MIMPTAPDEFTPLDALTSRQPPAEPSDHDALIEMDTHTPYMHVNTEAVDSDAHSHCDSHDSLHHTSTSFPWSGSLDFCFGGKCTHTNFCRLALMKEERS